MFLSSLIESGDRLLLLDDGVGFLFEGEDGERAALISSALPKDKKAAAALQGHSLSCSLILWSEFRCSQAGGYLHESRMKKMITTKAKQNKLIHCIIPEEA